MKKYWLQNFGGCCCWSFCLALIILLLLFMHGLILQKKKDIPLVKQRKDLLKNLDDDVQIDVFLKGEFPSGFRKLANSTEEFLELLKDRNGSKIHYRFISPLDEMPGTRITYGDSLIRLGAVPINLTVQKKAGESSNIIFPGAVMHYKGKQSLVNLYPGPAAEYHRKRSIVLKH